MLSIRERGCVEAIAAARKLEASAVLAVIAVESGGRVSVRIAGRDEPLIRWEGHYFDRLCDRSVRARAREAGLASPVAGAVVNPQSQAARWALLKRAAALDPDAAYASISWGVGQVMGEHWRTLGFESVDALVAEARSGFAGQVRLMMLFIEKAGLLDALRTHDWPAFARGYNGPRFRENAYDTKLAHAFEAISAGADIPDFAPALARGASGEAVSALQRLLTAAGRAVVVDGRFGPETEEAVRTFQKKHRLDVDGVAGARTMAALQAAGKIRRTVPAMARLKQAFLRWLAGLFGSHN